MVKNKIKFIFFSILFLMVFLIGCEGYETIKFDCEEIIVTEETKLPITIKNINKEEVIIECDNENVAIVDNGIIYPVAAGIATVTASYLEESISLDVFVTPKIEISDKVNYGDIIEFSFENGNISDLNIIFTSHLAELKNGKIYACGIGKEEIIFELKGNDRVYIKKEIEILPITPVLKADYTEAEIDEYIEFSVSNYASIKMFNLYSSDESVIKIDEDNYGYTLKPGKATIIAKLKSDENVSASIEIIVKNEQIQYKLSQNIFLVGDEFNIDFYNYSCDDDFVISISDENILKKTKEETYVVLKEGSAKVKAVLKVDPTISVEVEITAYNIEPIFSVYSTELCVGDAMKIRLLNYQNAEDFVWQIEGEELADFENYLLVAKKSGTVIVKVTKKDNPEINAKINIDIKPKQANLLVTSNNLFVGGKARLFIDNIEELETNDFSKFNIEISDPTILSREDDMITALKLGKTIIKVISKENSEIKGEVEVNVIETSKVTDINGEPSEGALILYSNDPKNYIHAGDFFQLHIDGATNNENYKWVSTDTKVATVNETGRIIAVNKGVTQIAAISKINKEVKGVIYVTVYGEPNVDYAARLVKIATEEIGYREGNNNDTKYGEWYNLNYEPWCAMFVSWCANQAGISTDIIPKYCGCTAGRKWFIDEGLYQARESGYLPKAGDIVFYRDTDETADISTHTGIVYACDGVRVYTIEGNTSDMCAKRSYLLTSAYILGYGTPNYPEFDGEAAIFDPGNPESGEHLPTV